MRSIATILTLTTCALLFTFGCSDDDSPTGSGEPQQAFLADTSAHLVTDILTFYGGNGWETGASVLELPDHSLAIAGSTDSYGSGKNTLYLVKTDPSGHVVWANIYGGGGEDNAEKVALTSGNNLIIGGVTSSFSDSYDFYLLEVSQDGALVWEKSIGSDGFEWGTDMVVLSDGYAIGGYSIPGDHSDGGNFDLVRTDLTGNVVWSKTYDRPDREWPYALTTTGDGGFILAGLIHYEGTNNVDAYLMRTDETGEIVWESAYGGSSDDKAFAVIQTSDGNFVAAGYSRSSSSENYPMLYIFKVDTDGELIWEQAHIDGGDLRVIDILENPDGSLVLTGNTSLEGTGTGMAKLDASGNLLWAENIGLASAGSSIIRSSDGKYTVTGCARDDVNTGFGDVLLMRVAER